MEQNVPGPPTHFLSGNLHQVRGIQARIQDFGQGTSRVLTPGGPWAQKCAQNRGFCLILRARGGLGPRAPWIRDWNCWVLEGNRKIWSDLELRIARGEEHWFYRGLWSCTDVSCGCAIGFWVWSTPVTLVCVLSTVPRLLGYAVDQVVLVRIQNQYGKSLRFRISPTCGLHTGGSRFIWMCLIRNWPEAKIFSKPSLKSSCNILHALFKIHLAKSKDFHSVLLVQIKRDPPVITWYCLFGLSGTHLYTLCLSRRCCSARSWEHVQVPPA